jgi:hypothetical protein
MLPALMGSAGIRHSAPKFAASLVNSPRSLSSPGLSYPVYTLGLDSVAAGARLSKAKLAAWRHEFSSGEEVVAAEVSAGRQPRFNGINVHSRFRSVSEELRSAAETSKGLADQSYQPRLLGARRSRALAEIAAAFARRRRDSACTDTPRTDRQPALLAGGVHRSASTRG